MVGGWRPGGWKRQIKNKDHLSPAEAEIRAELGKIWEKNWKLSFAEVGAELDNKSSS